MTTVVEAARFFVKETFKNYPTLSEFILSGIDNKTDDGHTKLNIYTFAKLNDEVEKLFGGK
jgi:hypothetical protein